MKPFENQTTPDSGVLANPPARLLVVDDDHDMADLLALTLRGEGYAIETGHSGADALQLLDEFAPDVLLLDLMMPDMTGQEVAGLIRARHDFVYVPIVMLTSMGSQEAVKLACMESGVDAFLSKPVTRAELKVTIRSMLRMKAAQDAMVVALDKVAAVQDSLLEYERVRGEQAAIGATIAACVRELGGPLATATRAATRLEAHSSADQSDLAQLRAALAQARGVVDKLSAYR